MKLEIDDKDAKVALRRLDDDLRIFQVIRGENWSEEDVASLSRVADVIREAFEELKPKKKKKEKINGITT